MKQAEYGKREVCSSFDMTQVRLEDSMLYGLNRVATIEAGAR